MRDQQSQRRAISSKCEWWVRNGSHRLLAVTNAPSGDAHGPVLFVPPFGMSIHALCMPALYAVSGGLTALRFDGRNNAGASEGEIIDYRLGVLLEDARFAAARLAEGTGRDDFIIVGKSMSSAVSLMLARDYPRSRALLYVPIVDIGWGVEQASGDHGGMAAYRRRDPQARRLQRIFGHDVRAQEFHDDLVATGLGTAEAVLEIARSVRGRADLVVAEHDQYARPELSRRLVEALDAEQRTLVLEGVSHDFGRSPVASKRGCAHLVTVANEHFRVPPEQRLHGPVTTATLVACAEAERVGMARYLESCTARD